MMITEVRTNTLLEIKHMSVDYDSTRGTVHAVNDVSFTIERGQIFGLAGESGSGKSTLAYALARLLQPPAVVTRGQVLYYPREREVGETTRGDGAVDVLALNPVQLRAFRWRELSIVFQSAMNALNPVLDIKTQIRSLLCTRAVLSRWEPATTCFATHGTHIPLGCCIHFQRCMGHATV